ncbi:MAG: hypothetical protein B7Z73_16520 [Planctomycetia bacterium 21-64-5]|nr:MAG: hypothetical protein B7Z73_16520 [Planctomycetia bacterium 21-64-5]
MASDVSKLPAEWERVETTLAQLHASTSELGAFLDRQWDELERLRCELTDQARELARRERELQHREEALTHHTDRQPMSIG